MAGKQARMKTHSAIDPDKTYPMNHPNMGHAVIVNNVSKELPGSVKDVEALKAAYEAVGFHVQVYNDCNSREMIKVKKFIMAEETHKDSNCFALIIICHGNDKGHLLDKDRKKAWDLELFVGELSDVDSLAGKPKILVVQSCRGTQRSQGRAPAGTLAQDEDLATPHIVADKADLYIAYATVPGYRAYGGDKDGSEYLQSFAHYLQQEYMRRPLDRIYLMVKQHMERVQQGDEGMLQVSEERSSLKRLLHFGEFYQDSASSTPSVDQSHDMELLRQKVAEARLKEAQRRKELKEMKEMMEKMEQMRTEEAERVRKLEEENRKLRDAATIPELPPKPPPRTHSMKPTQALQPSSAAQPALPTKKTTAAARPAAQKAEPKVTLVRRSSHCSMEGFGFAGLEETREVVKCYNYSYMVLDREVGPGELEQRMLSNPCGLFHNVYPLSITHQGSEKLGVSCVKCRDIKLMDIKTGRPTTVITFSEKYWPRTMCTGEKNRLFVYSLKSPEQVLELDTSKLPFKMISKFNTEMKDCRGMCFTKQHRSVVLSGIDSKSRSVVCYSVDGGEVVWKLCYAGAAMWDPWGVLYSERHDAILVCDDRNKRILVLSPMDCLRSQSIALPDDFRELYDLCWLGDQIVMKHRSSLSFWSVA